MLLVPPAGSVINRPYLAYKVKKKPPYAGSKSTRLMDIGHRVFKGPVKNFLSSNVSLNSVHFKGKRIIIHHPQRNFFKSILPMAEVARLISEKTFVDTSKVRTLLEKGQKEGVFPGCSLLVGVHGDAMILESIGSAGSMLAGDDSPSFPMNENTVFDISNLTQIVVTTTILIELIEEGRIDLNHRVSRYIPGFNILGKSPVTIGHLLSHTSGLPQTVPYYQELAQEQAGARFGILTSKGAKDYIITQIVRSSLKHEPGTRQQQSDLGFILLGSIIELLTGLPLEKAAYKYVFQPFGLKSTSFVDISMIRRRGIHPVTDLIAPTEECSWRGKLMWGEVLEENAWAMGGIAGHAGIFSSAADMHRFASLLLKNLAGKIQYLSPRVIRQFFQGGTFQFPTNYRFGWDSPCRENAMDDVGFSEQAVGMNGFTGCSMWIDPAKALSVVLMTNRVHPTRNNRKLHAFRAELFKIILSSL